MAGSYMLWPRVLKQLLHQHQITRNTLHWRHQKRAQIVARVLHLHERLLQKVGKLGIGLLRFTQRLHLNLKLRHVHRIQHKVVDHLENHIAQLGVWLPALYAWLQLSQEIKMHRT